MLYQLNFKADFSVTFDNTEEDYPIAYQCFIEILDHYFKTHNQEANGVARLLRYFNRDDVWFIDILHATTVATEQEKKELMHALYYVMTSFEVHSPQDQEILDTIEKEHVDPLLNIINHKENADKLDQYVRVYSTSYIPQVINGTMKPLV